MLVAQLQLTDSHSSASVFVRRNFSTCPPEAGQPMPHSIARYAAAVVVVGGVGGVGGVGRGKQQQQQLVVVNKRR